MNDWLKKQLTIQFERALKKGWLPFFAEAAKTHTKGFFDEADLIAIASRETNLDPKWLTKPGDNGNGFGLMQADRRSFPEFTRSANWKDARAGILFGAKVLMQKWADVGECIGNKRGVRSSKTGKMSFFIGKDVGKGAEAQKVTIASYNAGRWAHYAVSNGKNADAYTTGKDYSADVMARAAFFRPLMKKWMKENGFLFEEKPENSVLPVETSVNTDTSNTDSVKMPEDSLEVISDSSSLSSPSLPGSASSASSENSSSGSENSENSPNPETLTAYIPNIETGKSWLKKTGAFLTSSTVIAFFSGVPNWLIISLIALIAILIITGAVFLWKYQKQVFEFVAKIQAINADPTARNFVIKTHRSTLENPLDLADGK